MIKDSHICLMCFTGDAKTDKQWTFKGGFPQSWESAWNKLAWRHTRAHRPERVSRPTGSSSGCALGNDATSSAQAQPTQQELPLEILNGVTGLNNPKKDKVRAKADLDRQKTVGDLPDRVESVTVGTLVFISVELSSAEGELAVGLARAMQSTDKNECRFMWFIRKEWCVQPRKHEWSKTPTFRVAADPDDPTKPYITKEPLSKVLPLKVILTKASKANFPRLDANCVRMIKELCLQRDLVVQRPHSSHSARDQDDDSSDCNVEPSMQTDHMPQNSAHELISSRVRARKRNSRVVRDASSDEDDL